MLCCPLLASFSTWPTGGHSWTVRAWGRGHLQRGDNHLLRTNRLWALEVKCTLNSSYRTGPCKKGHQACLKIRGSYHSSGDQQDALPEASLSPWNSKVLLSHPGAQKSSCTWVEGESGPFSGLTFADGFSSTRESPLENATSFIWSLDTFIEHLLCARHWATQC